MLAVVSVDTTTDIDDGITTDITTLLANRGADGKISLREAIEAANGDAAHDTVVFDPAVFNTQKTITLDGTQLTISEDLTIEGPGADLLSISGNDASRVFKIDSGIDVTIEDVTITEGSATNANGGAIWSQGDLILERVAVSDSIATRTSGSNGLGGGVYSSLGSLEIVDSTIEGHTSWRGGGVAKKRGGAGEHFYVEDSTIAGNTANLSTNPWAGGILVDSSGTLDVQIVNSTISTNTATSVGGIFIDGSGTDTTVAIVNSTIAHNVATGAEGGIRVEAGTVTLDNTIVAKNHSDNNNTINVGANIDTANSHNNLIGFQWNDWGFTGTNQTDVSDANVGLAPLGYYGGRTKTHALLATSYAINEGNNDLAKDSDGNPLEFDQRGAGFSRFVEGAVDIGAFEFGAPITVSTLEDEEDGNYAPGHLSLREAIALAAVLDGPDTIAFDGNLFDEPGSIALSEELVVDSNSVLDGPGAELLTIDGDGNGRVFNVESGVDATIRGVTISGGYEYQGAGVYSEGDLVLDSVIITENEGNAYSGNGVAVYSTIGSLELRNSLVFDNNLNGPVAGYGVGGVYSYSATSLLVDGTEISGHENLYTGDEGIVADGTDTVVVTNSTIAGNTTDSEDTTSGISIVDALVVEIINTTVSGNVANGYGRRAGIRISGASTEADLIHVTVAHNESNYSAGVHVSGGADVALHNSIVAANGSGNQLSGSFLGSSSYNLIGYDPNGYFPTGNNNQIGISTPLDPRLAPLAFNGGPTKTHALLPDSPAINAGNNEFVEEFEIDFDQRGIGYPRILNSTVDIGATESYLKGVYDGILEIYGTENPDTILVSTTGISHSAFGEMEVDLSELDEVRIHGLGGDDYLALDAAFAAIGKLYGGEGHDDLYGGAAADFLFGELGDDELYGRGGDDTLDGGAGNDFLQGDDGNDVYTGGDGHDFFEPDAEDDLNAPVLDDIDDITIRRDMGLALRVLADDVETEYDQLDFDVVIDTQVIPNNWYSVINGVFRLVQNGWEAGTYETTITVTDGAMTDETTFNIILEDYNFGPPSAFQDAFLPGYFYNYEMFTNDVPQQTEHKDLTVTLLEGPPSAYVYLDDITNPSSPQWMLSWHPPGTRPDVPTEDQIDSEWYTPYNFVFEVSDDGNPDENARLRRFESHGVGAWLVTFDGYHLASEHASNDGVTYVQMYPLLAQNDQFGTDVGQPLEGTVNPLTGPGTDWIAFNTEFNLFDGPPEHVALDEYGQPQWEWDEQTGEFSFVPEAGFEGVVEFQYYLRDTEAWYEEHTWPNVSYQTVESNVATVTIEVGKAVRANLTIPGLDEEDEDQNGGKYILVNDDDDNVNNVEDRKELKGPVRDENDLVKVEVSYWLRDDVTPEDFVAAFLIEDILDQKIRLWTTADKEEEIIPYVTGADGTDFLLADLPSEIFVEGLGNGFWGPGYLGLRIVADQSTLFSDTEDDVRPGAGLAPTEDQDNVNLTVVKIDLDIDSDNNDGFEFPAGTDWEETLETHEYGLGKLIMLDNETRPFTPVRLRLVSDLDPDDPNLRVRIDWDAIGHAGYVRLWTAEKEDVNRINAPANEDGNRVYPETEYSLSELKYDPIFGTIELYAEGWDENELLKTLAGVETYVETNGKPDERIKATLIANGADLASDEVRYIVANEDSFFYHLQTRQEVRNGLASRGVYTYDDMPQFSLKPISDPELRKLNVPGEIVQLLGPGSGISGFGAMLYQDFITGEDQYVLGFIGTNPAEIADWITNIWQAAGWQDAQYDAAMQIADGLVNNTPAFTIGNLITTGHSLGGGLASAASMATGIKAHTFNAAGLHVNTLNDQLYPDSTVRYAGAWAWVDAYYVDWDLLSVVQNNTTLPKAIGDRIDMKAPSAYQVDIAFAALVIAGGFGTDDWETVATGLGSALTTLVNSHLTDAVLFGLLVDLPGVDLLGYEF